MDTPPHTRFQRGEFKETGLAEKHSPTIAKIGRAGEKTVVGSLFFVRDLNQFIQCAVFIQFVFCAIPCCVLIF